MLSALQSNPTWSSYSTNQSSYTKVYSILLSTYIVAETTHNSAYTIPIRITLITNTTIFVGSELLRHVNL